MRSGAAISVFAHVAALTACLVLAGVRPFDPTTAEAISVDIVTPDEVPKPKEKDPYEFPTLSEKEQQAAGVVVFTRSHPVQVSGEPAHLRCRDLVTLAARLRTAAETGQLVRRRPMAAPQWPPFGYGSSM